MYPEFSPHPEAPVLVLGAASLDLVGRLENPLRAGTSSSAQIRMGFGGVARNIAENLARLGQPVTLLTAIGQDEIGDRLLTQVEAAGADISSVLRTADYPTGSYLAVIDQKGELAFALDDMHAMQALTPAYLHAREHLFMGASVLFVDMNLSPQSLKTALSLARKARLPVCVDPTSLELTPRILPHLSRFHFITPNGAEAAMLAGTQLDTQDHNRTLELASSLVSRGVKIVIITLAEFGVCYATPDARGYIPAMRTEILDPTGAGDALTSAVIFALLNDIPLDEAVRIGVTAASLTLRYQGAVRPDLSLEKLYNHLVI